MKKVITTAAFMLVLSNLAVNAEVGGTITRSLPKPELYAMPVEATTTEAPVPVLISAEKPVPVLISAPEVVPIAAEIEYKATINDENVELEDAKIYNANGLMLPIRKVAETLGYNVTWDNENAMAVLEKGNVKIALETKTNKVTVNGNALNSARFEIVNDRMYVNVKFINEALETFVDSHNEYVTVKEVAKYPVREGNVTEVRSTDYGYQVFIGDMQSGTVFNLSEKTIIEDKDGNTLKIEDIKEGDSIKVHHREMMTMSLPPITGAIKIIK